MITAFTLLCSFVAQAPLAEVEPPPVVLVKEITGYAYRAKLLYSPDGKYFATWKEKEFNLWKVGPPAVLVKQDHAYSALFSPDSQRVLVAFRGNQVRVYDARSGQTLPNITLPFDRMFGIASLTWSPDGKHLAAGVGRDVLIVDTKDYQTLRRFRLPNDTYAHTLAFADDRRLFVMRGFEHDETGGLNIFNIATGAEEKFEQQPQVSLVTDASLALAPDRATFAYTIRYGGFQLRDDVLGVWDAKTLEKRYSVPLHTSALAYSPDGRWLVLSGVEKEKEQERQKESPCALRIIDAADGKTVRRVPRTSFGPMHSFTFSPDGKTLAAWPLPSGDEPPPLHLWDWTKITADLPKP